ncbi:Tuberous sclerosis 2-like protein [Entomophthora muscae]|uniref:Tuberous sclerosis 2-like protein n=1 Tax=Entomophthora muscae TaxID=34485 RepID=A0ACC2T6G0_9FUNG|nr:Tuberous sclerosis 2-like protein [Entomophthora muscae]
MFSSSSYPNSLNSCAREDAWARYSFLLEKAKAPEASYDAILEAIQLLPLLNLVEPTKLWPLVLESLKGNPDTQTKEVTVNLIEMLLACEEKPRVVFRLLLYSSLRKGSLLQGDMQYILRLLDTLTKGGRNLVGLERDFAGFLCTLLESRHGETSRLLLLICNVLKFNFSNLNSHEIRALLERLVHLKQTCPWDEKLDEGQLEVLDALVRYGFVHEPCLEEYLKLTCCLLEGPLTQERVWGVVHNLFRSHCAYQSLSILCNLVEVEGSSSAMHLLSTSLWGASRIATLSFPASSILISIRKSCFSQAACVRSLEVLNTLIECSDVEMGFLEWELAFDIISQAGLYSSPSVILGRIFEDYTQDKFTGDVARLMKLLADYFSHLSIEQSIGLLEYYDDANLFVPSCSDWQELVSRVVARFCSREHLAFRAELLKILVRSFNEASEFHLEYLIESIVMPLLASVYDEHDRDLVFSIVSLTLDAISLASPSLRHRLVCHLIPQTPDGYVPSQVNHTGPPLDACIAVLAGCSFLWSLDESDFLLDQLQVLLNHASLTCCAKAKAICFHLLTGLRANSEFVFVGVAQPNVSTIRTALRNIIFEEQSVNNAWPTTCEQEITPASDRLEDLAVASLPTAHRTCMLRNSFPCQVYLQTIISCLGVESSWQIVSLLLKFLPVQLANLHLFYDARQEIDQLRHCLFVWITSATFLKQVVAVPETLRRGDLYVAAYRLLGPLVGFKAHFNKQGRDEVVLAYQMGLHKWPTTARVCIHALTICCFELQMSMMKLLPSTLVKLSQIMSAATISAHILEFLACLARLPSLYGNFVDADFKRVFGIALQYIQNHNHTGEHVYLQYVLVLAYHVISVWFVNLRLADRRKLIPFIYRGLQLANPGEESDEQTDACLDMLARYAFSTHHSRFSGDLLIQSLMNGGSTQSWIRGDMLVSIQAAPPLKWLHVMVRRPSGTVSWVTERFQPSKETVAQTLVRTWGVEAQQCLSAAAGINNQPELPPLPPPPESEVKSAVISMLKQRGVRCSFNPPNEPSSAPREVAAFDPGFLHLGLGSRGPVPPFIPTPPDDATNRAINVLDRMPVVDFHKIGVVYVGAGQACEKDILSNRAGSLGYSKFIRGLGKLVRLQGCRDIYTGGLDTEMDLDGSHTWAWGDGLSQLIFHVATMMPTNPATDPQCAGKKRHIGNDYVCIVYNDSCQAYVFNTLPGQFNLVNLVVTPIPCSGDQESYYLVQAQVRQDLPELSPLLEPKLVSSDQVSCLVRQLSLHAAIFAQVFLKSGSYATNWTERLRQIRLLRSRLPSN